MSEIDKKLTEIKARADRQLQETLMKQLSLPFVWEDSKRGIPNGLLRSPVFAATARGDHPHVSRRPLPSVEGVDIVYTGIRLSQDYLTLWAQLIHVAREQELGTRCETSTYKLLKAMRKSDSGKNRDILYRMLAELQATAIELTQGRYTYTGSLIEGAYRDNESGKVVVVLNKKMVALFQRDQFTKVSWDIRLSLTKKPMAQWLHSFYSTHEKPFAYKVETLHRLCGSNDKSLKQFGESTLVKGLEALAEKTQEHGLYFGFSIVDGLVHVTHCATTRLPNKPAST